MSALCTYCSKRKSHESGEIPAIRRYKSERIERVYQAARTLTLPFFILSGRFGLVRPEECIPDYDHLLKPDEVPALATRLVEQMDRYGLGGLVYFTEPLVGNVRRVPYHAALSAACFVSSRPFLAVELEEINMSDWKDVMQAAESAKEVMSSNRVAGEMQFELLLTRHPHDGMTYFKRGEAYEALGESTLAGRDFGRAMELLPKPEWKQRAREAWKRVTRQGGKRKERDPHNRTALGNRRSKYFPLTELLRNQTGNCIQLTFTQIEREIGDELPSSARKYREWWANEAASDTRHRQCRAWQSAGWKVEGVDLTKESVVFRHMR